ncbi:MAG: 1-deoxy-D-xylulose-5-phosphate reductoisomerase [Ruminococcus sp.]|nr:1-deoxy-D-xylulose-5-phosphate reductoisomerase [Ruminococcus sp.]
MTKSMVVLGSTGSIGTQTLDVAEKYNMKICALTAHSNVKLIEEQARKFKPSLAVMFDETAASDLKIRLADTDTRVLCGMNGLIEAASLNEADVVLNSLVGMVGLEPTLAACKAGKDIALANKETLVAGGELVMNAVKESGVALLPVDSEHSAIFQCLQACPDKKFLKKLILTASGGPFFGKTKAELCDVTVEQALAHPNWSMGAKITVDSASMMNKGLEIIEARWLFDVTADNIDVVVHRQSIIHSLIEFTDNSVLAQLGVPDMRIPIQYALTYPERVVSPVGELDLTSIGTLTFDKPDYETFECLTACKAALNKGGTSPAIANGANEAANLLFRQAKIPFLKIGELVTGAVADISTGTLSSLSDVLSADKAAREYVMSAVQ